VLGHSVFHAFITAYAARLAQVDRVEALSWTGFQAYSTGDRALHPGSAFSHHAKAASRMQLCNTLHRSYRPIVIWEAFRTVERTGR
jgi:hypothetical protein